MTSTGAVASLGTIPTSGATSRQARNRIPTTTAVSPVRPPSETPAALSMYVVFDDAEAAPPAAAARESTSAEVMTSPTANTPRAQPWKCATIVTGGTGPGLA